MDDPAPTVDAPSKPPRRFRRTRIAVSVFFGVLTLALCVLWVRSYWWASTLDIHSGTLGRIYLEAQRGELFACYGPPVGTASWTYYGQLDVELNNRSFDYTTLGFYLGGDDMFPGILIIDTPFWFLVAATIALSAAPWSGLSPRFSLRTMLIVTTLVAAVLGLGVWLAR